MLNPARFALFFLALPLILGCSREVAPGRLSDQSPGQVAYDVTKDPLVNPPQLFEPLPEHDLEAASTDATLIRRTGNSPTNLNPIFNNLWVDHHVRIEQAPTCLSNTNLAYEFRQCFSRGFLEVTAEGLGTHMGNGSDIFERNSAVYVTYDVFVAALAAIPGLTVNYRKESTGTKVTHFARRRPHPAVVYPSLLHRWLCRR